MKNFAWSLILPELGITLIMFIVLILDMFLKKYKRSTISTIVIAGIGILSLICLFYAQNATIFDGMYEIDSLSWYFKTLLLIVAIFIAYMFYEYLIKMDKFKEDTGVFYLLSLICLNGMLFLVSANDLIILFIAIEIISIPFYVMISYELESGLKYLILSIISSAMLLYGIALVYGASGTTNFDVIKQYIAVSEYSVLAKAGIALILSGICFKIALVPFHMWVPDSYQGAPVPVIAFLATGSKMAGFIAVMRLFFIVFLPLKELWLQILPLISAITMIYGSLSAIPQKNIKRLLGYISIGHAGYLIMGIIACSHLGAAAMVYDLTASVFAYLGLFFVIVTVSTFNKEVQNLDDYSGIAKRSPFLALAILISLFSIAGIPPLAGFFGKFLLISAIVKSGYIWLAFIAVAMVVVTLYYSLLVIKIVFIREPQETSSIKISLGSKIAITASIIAIIVLGIFQQPFLKLAIQSTKTFF